MFLRTHFIFNFPFAKNILTSLGFYFRVGDKYFAENFINLNTGGLGLLVNPQSNLIRILFEGGLLGLAIYVLFQIKII